MRPIFNYIGGDVPENTELYAVRAVGWKKGGYTGRDFEDVNSEVQITEDGSVHLILRKTFGGYNGDDKYTERVFDIKFDSISVERLKGLLNEKVGVIVG